MANEGVTTSLNATQASALSQALILTLQNRDTSPLARIAAYYGSISGSMSTVSNERLFNEVSALASPGEIVAAPNTEPTFTLAPITVSRRTSSRALSALLMSTDGQMNLNPAAVAGWLITSLFLGMLSSAAALFTSITQIVGTSGVDLSQATVQAAIDYLTGLGANVAVILHPTQVSQWRTDYTSLGGGIPFNPGVQQIQALANGAYLGSWNNVDFFQSDRVPDDGTDYFGAAIAYGAIGWKSGDVPAPRDNSGEMANGGWYRIDSKWDPITAVETVVLNAFMGFGIIQQRGLCAIRSRKP